MSITKKVFAAAITATTVVSMLGMAALPLANAQSSADLQAQIAALLSQIQQLQGQLNGSSSGSTSASYNFTRDLTVGSTGADVTSLQNLLISKGYLKIAAATAYFGSLSQRALASFQAANGISPAAGYFGPKSRAFVNAMSSGSTGGNTGGNTGGGVPVPASGLSVSLSSGNPSSGALISSNSGSGAARIPVLSVNLTAGNSGAVTVSEIKFHKTGVLADNSISGAYLTQNGQVIAQYNSINQGVVDFSGLNLSIGAGQTQELTLAIDVSGGLSAGNTTGFSLQSASDVTAWSGNNVATTASGAFPVNGNTFTVTTVSNPALATLAITSSSIGTSVTAGTQGNLVGAWNFSVGNSAVWLKSLNFHVIGSANMANVQNVKLMVNGTQVGGTLSSVSSNGTAYFNMQSSPAKLNTGSNNIQVFADVMGSPNMFFQFEILNGFDVLAVDSQYNVPVAASNTGGVGSQVSIQAGQSTVTQNSGTPTGSIAKGTSQVTLAKFNVYASGEPVRIKFMTFKIAFTGGTVTSSATLANAIGNISLVDDAGGQVGSTINTPPTTNACTDNNGAAVTAVTTDVYTDCFGTSASPINYQVPANTTRVLSLKADVKSTATFSSITASLVGNSGNLQGVISSNTGNTGSASGVNLGLANSSLTVSANNGLGNQNVSAGVTNQRIGSYTFQAASAEGVNVNNVQVQANGANFQNLHVMVNGAQFGSTQGTVSSGTAYTFSGTPFSVPAGGSVNVDVYADTISSASGSVSPATKVTGLSATGAISFSSIGLQSSVTSVSGQNLSFGGNPAITVTADSTQAPTGQIVMGSSGNSLGIFRFTETSNIENVKVTDLQVIDTVGATASTTAVKAAFSNLQLFNGSTLLGTAGAPVADASGTDYIYTFHLATPVIIPQANSVSVTLKGDAASYASQGATDNSTHAFKISTTSDTTNTTSTQTVVALGATSNKSTAVTLTSATGNTQTVLRSTLGVTVAALNGANHSKSATDNLGTITFTANSAGPVKVNSTTITLSGSAAASTTASLQLIDANGLDAVSAGEAASTTGASSKAYTFGSGFQISGGTSYTFTVRVNSLNAPVAASTAQSLGASIQNNTDVGYTDGADASSTSGINIPASVVPLLINSVTYPVGS
jgi:trimeric autotransporter adhesin